MESLNPVWKALAPYAKKVELSKKEVIVDEGEISDNIFFVESGCLRSWFNHDGKDVSFQFFQEGTMVASFESFMFDEPSPYTIETILPSILYVVSKYKFREIVDSSSEIKEKCFQLVCRRLRHYQRLFLSRIKDTPQQRYEELINKQPDLIRMIPQHYIASYLGITSVSLSRIRCRK